ncbi:MAG TPA: hypothetical protein VGE72_17910 [Azospirillum sp.]
MSGRKAAPPVPAAPEAPVPKGAEKNLLDAIARLEKNKPTDPELKQRAKAGKLRVNPTTAALEAGCSRRLAYKFPRVRKALGIGEDEEATSEAGKEPARTGKSLQEVVVQLRREKTDLKRERDLALSRSAALVVRLRQMEREVAREVRKATRRAKRPENPNQIAGKVHRLFPADEE